MSAAALLVEAAGLLTTVQDAGRVGWQRFGISPAGAMDCQALRLGNALLGNSPGTAALEITASGPTLRVEGRACRIAVAGDMEASVEGRPLAPWTGHRLEPGAVLRCGSVRGGLRAYLAVGGGFGIEPVLGSLSTHTATRLGGVEGRALVSGDRLPLRETGPDGDLLELAPAGRPVRGGPLRVCLGPQAEAFTPEGVAAFLLGPYTVGAKANRMGLQLEGPFIAHAASFNIVSDGIVHGSIQVTGQGQPLVLLADRQTTGGYTKIATVIGPDLPRLGQCRPGDRLVFALVSVEEAEACGQTFAAAERASVAAMRPTVRVPSQLSAASLLGTNLISGMISAQDAVTDFGVSAE